MRVTDAFEIKDVHKTRHAPGLVVVVDSLVTKDPTELVGKLARIRTPSGTLRRLPIHEAKEHGPVNSLFFKGLTLADVPLQSEIDLEQSAQHDAKRTAASPAS